MRIIAGEFRGRTLLPPSGTETRPITDRVKQSVFDILAPLLPEAVVFDLFAGTGSMGLECLSRNARRATFFEADRPACLLLKKNIESLRVAGRSKIVAGDIFNVFAAPTSPSSPDVADVCFLDPPYRFLVEQKQKLQSLAERLAARMSRDGTLVFRHDAADQLALPRFVVVDRRTYGQMMVEFLRPDPREMTTSGSPETTTPG